MQGGVFLKRWILGAALCCVFLAGCGANEQSAAEQDPLEHGEAASDLLPEDQSPVAGVEGEAISPDGVYKVLTAGVSEKNISGVWLPETLQIIHAETKEILWEDMGYLRQCVSWSPDGSYLALAYGGRTWNQILLFETDAWTTWQFTLPDGSVIPEYTFLPEDWAEWLDESSVRITTGLGGDAGERQSCICSVAVEEGHVAGHTFFPATKILDESRDFNHNGVMETLILEGNAETMEKSSFWGLKVREGEEVIWLDTAATSHAGWNNLFALKLDGKDYLLRYHPSMWQGVADYHYRVFSLNEDGEESVCLENRVKFDTNFQSPFHQGFDSVEVAGFLEEIHGYLEQSALLLSTEGGVFRSGDSGAEFREDGSFWDEVCSYDKGVTMEENVRRWEAAVKAAREVS